MDAPEDAREDATNEPTGEERLFTGEALETESGTRRPQQMNVGKDNMEGGGEWPDPNTPPRPPAPGAVEAEDES